MWILLACASEPETLLLPDPTRDGADGSDGPWGVARIDRVYPTRVSDAVETIVLAPYQIGSDGTFPTVVFDHGGFVDPERYLWMAQHVASRGYVVALPRFPLLLAITAPGNSAAALDGVLGDSYGASLPAAVGGHSLGGVTGTMAWVDDPRFEGVFVLASFPAASTDVEGRTGGAVISLIGDEDGSADLGATESGFARFPEPRLFGLIAGLTHYGWTDDASAADLANEQVPSRPVDEARRDAMRIYDPWLDATVRDDPDAQALLDGGAFPNVTVSR